MITTIDSVAPSTITSIGADQTNIKLKSTQDANITIVDESSSKTAQTGKHFDAAALNGNADTNQLLAFSLNSVALIMRQAILKNREINTISAYEAGQMALDAIKDQAKDMKKAAQKQFTAAIATAIGQAAMGAAQFSGGVKGAYMARGSKASTDAMPQQSAMNKSTAPDAAPKAGAAEQPPTAPKPEAADVKPAADPNPNAANFKAADANASAADPKAAGVNAGAPKPETVDAKPADPKPVQASAAPGEPDVGNMPAGSQAGKKIDTARVDSDNSVTEGLVFTGETKAVKDASAAPPNIKPANELDAKPISGSGSPEAGKAIDAAPEAGKANDAAPNALDPKRQGVPVDAAQNQAKKAPQGSDESDVSIALKRQEIRSQDDYTRATKGQMQSELIGASGQAFDSVGKMVAAEFTLREAAHNEKKTEGEADQQRLENIQSGQSEMAKTLTQINDDFLNLIKDIQRGTNETSRGINSRMGG